MRPIVYLIEICALTGTLRLHLITMAVVYLIEICALTGTLEQRSTVAFLVYLIEICALTGTPDLLLISGIFSLLD